MAKKDFLIDIDVNKNQLLNIKLQNLATAPVLTINDKGFTYFDTTEGLVKTWNGTSWTSGGGLGTTNLSHTKNSSSVTIQSSTGTSTTIPSADSLNAGVMSSEMFNNLTSVMSGLNTHKHYQLYKPDGSTVVIYTDAAGKVHIDGDIIQSGTNYITHAENLNTTKDTITLREGAVAGLGSGEYAGLTAKLYDGVNDGRLIFDNTGTARVGDIGNEQALATRIDNPANGHIAYWDSANLRLNFKQLIAADISNLDTYLSSALAGSANKLQTARTIAISGAVTGTATSFDGTANIIIPVTLPDIATAGTFKSVTINSKGQVTAGTNPTTLAGYGITDATKKYSIDITGTGSATSFTVTHNLNTTDIITFIKEATTSAKIETEEIVTSANVLTINFNTAPANGKVYRVTVVG